MPHILTGFAYQEFPSDVDFVQRSAREAEAAGFDIFALPETAHDPFPYLAAAALATEQIEINVNAVALARNPMAVAMLGNDMQAISHGRFSLGLSSQIKPNIVKRYSMPWSEPAARMEEFLNAVQHIWGAWRKSERVNFRGKFYRHTFNIPFYTPAPSPYPDPVLGLAAHGPLMTEAAGAVADRCGGHVIADTDYIDKVTEPALQRGADRAGRERSDIQYARWVSVATGDTEEELTAAIGIAKTDLAVHLSTPMYESALERLGYEGLKQELSDLVLYRRYSELSSLIDDRLFRHYVASGEPQVIGREARRFITPQTNVAMCVVAGHPSPLTLERVVQEFDD